MKEFKIVKNQISEKFVVVELDKEATSPSIGIGRTKSEAMRNALSNHRFAEKTIKGGVEDIFIHFNYEE